MKKQVTETKWYKSKLLIWIAFIVVGILITTTSCVIHLNWMKIGRWLLNNPKLVFDQQPEWMRVANWSVSLFPWVVGGVILIWAIIRKKVIPVIAYSIGAILPMAVLVGYIFFAPSVEDYSKRIYFDSRVWKNTELAPTTNYPRLRMVNDLLKKYELKGMSRPEIETLLGLPDKTPYFSSWDMVYHLGPERGFMSIDSEWLVIRVNDQGTVYEHRIVTD
jgi:hypothetical protein